MKLMLKVIVVSGISLVLGGSMPDRAQAFACGKCATCIGGHTNPYSELDRESEGIHAGCVAVAGCPHPDCIQSFAPANTTIERALAAVETGDREAARTLLRSYPSSVVWNKERGALQLRAACVGDGFVAHIPLTEAQNRYLAAD